MPPPPLNLLSLRQTGEMGLTQNVGEDGIKFEVWVRQATRTRDCVTLQAKDREEKAAWTQDVAHLLWTHAINNTGRSTTKTIYNPSINIPYSTR